MLIFGLERSQYTEKRNLRDKGNTVLDLGCGNGALTQALHDKGYIVKGIDASGELLDIAREHYPELEFIQGDATDFILNEPVDVLFPYHW